MNRLPLTLRPFTSGSALSKKSRTTYYLTIILPPTKCPGMRQAIDFLKHVFSHFSKSNTFQEGAALAYYTVFSILPMIMIVISIFGFIWGEAAVSGEVYKELSSTLGRDAAEQIQGMISSQHQQHRNIITVIIGFATLALGATGMFNQLHTAFNNIWGIAAKPRSSFLAYASKHLVAFLILIITFFLLMLSLAINSFLLKYGSDFINSSAGSILLEHIISFSLIAVMFTLMFKFLGDAIVHWKLALMGGLFTAILFLVGKFAIGWYIGRSSISSTFGSASVLALLMLWVYYTSQILFLGASFLYVLGEKLGLRIGASEDAVLVVKQEVNS